MTDHQFKTAQHAAVYAKFRPTPPVDLIERIVSLAKSKEDLLDVGCGSGQSTEPMTSYFKKVVGIDISPAQIEEAKKRADEKNLNIDYRVSPAYPLPFDDNSFDVITGSQCVHWFDLDKFYAETRRVLRKDGILAMFGYCMPVPFIGDPAADAKSAAVADKFNCGKVSAYWDTDRSLIDDCYRQLKVPKEGFTFAERQDSIVKTIDSSINDYIAYLSSWSPYRRFLRENPNEPDPLVEIREDLTSAFGGLDNDVNIKVRISFFLVAYRKTN